MCSLILSAVLCFLLRYLSGYQQEQQAKLAETQKSFDILCVVTNRRGTQSSGLRMSSGVISPVTMGEFYDLPKHIRDLRMVKEYEINCPVLGIFDAYLMGVTSERCAEDLDPAMGGGVVCGEASFYESEEMVCLVSQEAYAALGDDKTVKIMVTDPVIDRTENPELGWGSISFLATRGESRTYALMRTMGMTRGKLFFSVLREQIVLPAVSVLLVAVLTEEIPSAGFYLLCYATGCCAAVIRAVRTAPTAILREQE